MLSMGICGAGNLMFTALLVPVFAQALQRPGGLQIVLLAVVPLVTQPLFLPAWARLLDGSHAVRYRSRQGRALVAAPRSSRSGCSRARWHSCGSARWCSARHRPVLI